MNPIPAMGGTRAGYSIVEVLASLAIFLFGVIAIVNFFPNVLRAQDEAALMSVAALLAQEKASEIRRDDLAGAGAFPLTASIATFQTPTPPEVFPRHPQLAYSFCGRSIEDPVDDPNDPSDDIDVPRVIVLRYRGTSPPNPADPASWDVLAEYRFDVQP